MIAWAVLIVLMIPSALGRCDPGHVFTGGLGAILLMFALLGRRHPRMFIAYSTVFFLMVVVIHITGICLYADQLWSVKQALCTGKRVEINVGDPALALVKNVKSGSIADPFALFCDTERYLRKEGRFLSESYPDTFDLFDQAAVDRKLEGLKNINAVMVPKSVLVFKDIDPRENLPPYLVQDMEQDERKLMSMLFLYPVPYEMKHLRFNATFVICRYLATHFEPVIGDENVVIMGRVRR